MKDMEHAGQVNLFEDADGPVSMDEQRLIELFRLMSDTERHDLLVKLSMQTLIELSKVAIGTAANPIAAPTEQDESDPTEFTDESLSFLQPPQEPWDFLDEWMGAALAYAWPEGVIDAVLGSSTNDLERAADLLQGVEHYAEQANTESPWFGEKEMLAFIRAWREGFMAELGRLAKVSRKDR